MMIGITLLLCLSDGLEVIMVYTLHVRHLLDISPVNLPFFVCPILFILVLHLLLVCVIIIIIIIIIIIGLDSFISTCVHQ